MCKHTHTHVYHISCLILEHTHPIFLWFGWKCWLTVRRLEFLSDHWYQLYWNPEHISCTLWVSVSSSLKNVAVELRQPSGAFQLYAFSEFLNILLDSLPACITPSPRLVDSYVTDLTALQTPGPGVQSPKPTPVSYILFCCLVSPAIIMWPTEGLTILQIHTPCTFLL